MNMKSIHYEYAVFGREKSRYCDETLRLMIPVHGHVIMETESGRRKMIENNMLFLPVHKACYLYSDMPNECLVVEMPENYARLYLSDGPADQEGCQCPVDHTWDSIRELLLNEVNHNNREGVILLLNYLLSKINSQHVSDSICYIHTHFAEKIDIKSLAAMEHYTPSYYCDWFKRKMKMTPLEYVHYLRIQRAKELLCDSKLSILAISYQIGYEYNASFTKMFKKYEHVSPSEFRMTAIQ
ncbi:AraC family transcriptional regulator [Sporolactobacillus sp. THM7-4]|nr:AraC family transcriptional regulator [Sporolactobacillus sp. THM7-4]